MIPVGSAVTSGTALARYALWEICQAAGQRGTFN